MTVAQAYKLFIKNRSVYCSPETIKTYNGHNICFFSFLEETYHKTMDSLAFEMLPPENNIFSDFILYLRSTRQIKNTTVRSYCRSVKTFLRFCYEENFCRDYLLRVKLPKDDAAPKVPLYVSEVKVIDAAFDLSTIKGCRNYCIFHLMLDCGLRSQEVRHLQVHELDAPRNLIKIQLSKGCKSRITLIPTFLLEVITVYLEMCCRSSGTVFLSLRDSKPLTSNAIKQLFQDLKQETGIDRLHAHLLRHTFATSFLIGGGNMEFLRVFMGHSDYNVTKGYSQLAAQCKMLGVDVYHLDSIFFTRGY